MLAVNIYTPVTMWAFRGGPGRLVQVVFQIHHISVAIREAWFGARNVSNTREIELKFLRRHGLNIVLFAELTIVHPEYLFRNKSPWIEDAPAVCESKIRT